MEPPSVSAKAECHLLTELTIFVSGEAYRFVNDRPGTHKAWTVHVHRVICKEGDHE